MFSTRFGTDHTCCVFACRVCAYSTSGATFYCCPFSFDVYRWALDASRPLLQGFCAIYMSCRVSDVNKMLANFMSCMLCIFLVFCTYCITILYYYAVLLCCVLCYIRCTTAKLFVAMEWSAHIFIQMHTLMHATCTWCLTCCCVFSSMLHLLCLFEYAAPADNACANAAA